MRITGTTLQVDADAFRMEQRAVNESLTARSGTARHNRNSEVGEQAGS